MIQLEVATREEEGWQEEVEYWEGSKLAPTMVLRGKKI